MCGEYAVEPLPINIIGVFGQHRLISGYHLLTMFSNELRLSTEQHSIKQLVCNNSITHRYSIMCTRLCYIIYRTIFTNQFLILNSTFVKTLRYKCIYSFFRFRTWYFVINESIQYKFEERRREKSSTERIHVGYTIYRVSHEGTPIAISPPIY